MLKKLSISGYKSINKLFDFPFENLNVLIGANGAGKSNFISFIGKPGHKGGVISYQRAKHDIIKLLKQDKRAFCTTMFDFYKLPKDFPGFPLQANLTTEQKARKIEQAFYDEKNKSAYKKL